MVAAFAAILLGCAETETIPTVTTEREPLPLYNFRYWYKATQHWGDYGWVVQLSDWTTERYPFGAVYSTHGEIYLLKYGTDFNAIVKEPEIRNYKKWGVDRIVLEIDGYTSVWYSENGYTNREVWHSYAMKHHMTNWDGHIPELIQQMTDEGILYRGSRFDWYYIP